MNKTHRGRGANDVGAAAAACVKRSESVKTWIEEQIRRPSTRATCAHAYTRFTRRFGTKSEKKCHVRQFHAILDVCWTGSHARTSSSAQLRAQMRVRRRNFHIISPSPTRSLAGATTASGDRPVGGSRRYESEFSTAAAPLSFANLFANSFANQRLHGPPRAYRRVHGMILMDWKIDGALWMCFFFLILLINL